MTTAASRRRGVSVAEKASIIDQTSAAEFQPAVERTLEYIRAGDIYQANIAASWRVRTRTAPRHLYQNLISINPSKYGGFFSFFTGDRSHAILSVSPELFVQRRQGRLLARPIKGTRPRRPTNPQQDQAAAGELLSSIKDQAELAMIVDLLRNDLGRICRAGTIHVNQARTLECHPMVWHTVADISGALTDGHQSWSDIIVALCPAGSITGTPKIRATQIIAELEHAPRGIYCGHIGWIGPRCDGALNIAIRTAHQMDDILTFRGGAGIVADSNPAMEYQEILAKVRAMLHLVDAQAID